VAETISSILTINVGFCKCFVNQTMQFNVHYVFPVCGIFGMSIWYD